jgi:hypothetical protein
MGLTAGTKLGPYEPSLRAGGREEVYRVRDKTGLVLRLAEKIIGVRPVCPRFIQQARSIGEA